MPRVRANLLCWFLRHDPERLLERGHGAVLEWRCRRCGGYFFTQLKAPKRYSRARGGRSL